MIRTESGQNLHLAFDSIAELASMADGGKSKNSRSAAYESQASNHWHGGTPWADLVHIAQNGGEETNVEAARKIYDKIEASFEARKATWAPSVAGAYPCVPDFLSGFPEPMRRKVDNITDSAPISIWVPTTCSAGITRDCLLARGTALLAFAMALTNSGRTVELSVCCFTGRENHKNGRGEVVVSARLSTTPLSLAEASFALCHIGYTRAIQYSLCSQFGFGGRWPYLYNTMGEVNYCADIAKRAGVTVVAPPAHLNDQKQIQADPVAWLNGKIGNIKALLGEDAAD